MKTTSTKKYISFKSDLINNVDHIRISGTGPLSVIESLKFGYNALLF